MPNVLHIYATWVKIYGRMGLAQSIPLSFLFLFPTPKQENIWHGGGKRRKGEEGVTFSRIDFFSLSHCYWLLFFVYTRIQSVVAWGAFFWLIIGGDLFGQDI